MTTQKPLVKPANPCFSSGPTAKRPGFSLIQLENAVLGRSHRSKVALARLQQVIDLHRELLRIPDDYRIAIVPASDTGAVEMAMWSLLGPNPVTVMAWETFGQDWVTDTVKQLKISPEVRTAPYGQLPDLKNIPPENDIIFTWNGTTSGTRVPNADWIAADRTGVTICDATSAIFAQDLEWPKLDVVTWSWQKILGGEAAHGMLVLSPHAVARLESHTPEWPVPKLFRMTKSGKLDEALFKASTINTPSMLCVEDCVQALNWAKNIGGYAAMKMRSDTSLSHINDWVFQTSWVRHLCEDAALRSNTGVCVTLADSVMLAKSEDDQRALVKAMEKLLENEGIAFDVANHRNAPPGIRIWCGATVEPDDVKALLPWLDWAYATVNAA